MTTWLMLLILAVIFLLLEMFTPTLFFINLSIAAFASAIFSYCGYSLTVVTLVFLFVSIVTIALIRPLLINSKNIKDQKTGMEDKYIGKIAKVVKEVSSLDGRISIYGEEWQARTSDSSVTIPVGEDVKIISNDSIILTVEKIKEN